MKAADVAQKTDQELTTLLTESRKELSQLTLEMRTKQIKGVKQIRALKRTIARVLTVQRARELEEQANG